MSTTPTSAFDGAFDGVVMIDEHGTITYINTAAERMFGRPRESAVGKELAALMLPERLRAAHREALERLRRPEGTMQGRRFAVSALDSSGREFPVELTVSPTDGPGRARYVGFLRDETDRLRAEAERDRLAAIVESSSDGFCSCDLDGTITSWNAAAERMLGYAAPEIIGQSVTVLAPPSRAAFAQEFLHRIAGGNAIPTFESVMLKRDNTPLDVEVTFSPILAPSGAVVQASAAIRDISERKQAQLAIARQARLLRTVRDALIETDAQFRILTWNPAATALYGWTEAEAVGRDAADILYTRMTDEGREQMLRDLHEHGHVLVEAVQQTRTGADIQVEASILALRDDDESIVGYVALNRDVSARLRLEQRLREARQLEAIGRLAGGVAHDFNNLLTALLGYGELVLSDIDLSPSIRSDVSQMMQAGERAAVLTRQLLAFSRQQVLRPRAVDINVIVRDSARAVHKLAGESVDVELRLDPSVPAAEVDPTQIEQVLMDLVENACEAMPDGGRLTIATLATRESTGELPPGDYVRLVVSDTGHGMDERTQERAFEPYFTTRSTRAGLGLATAYGVARQSGGDIDVESSPGTGARFSVILPAAAR